MPTSSGAGKGFAISSFARLCAKTPIDHVVDVGPGLGTYAKIFGAAAPGPRWTGVEAWAPYIRQFDLPAIYDRLVVADVRFLDFRKLGPTDLFIFGDVLEHMAKAEAVAAVDEALTRARFAMISIPIVDLPQGEFAGNPFEAHVKPDWSDDEVRRTFPGIAFAVVEQEIGIYWLARAHDDARLLGEIGADTVATWRGSGRWAPDLGI